MVPVVGGAAGCGGVDHEFHCLLLQESASVLKDKEHKTHSQDAPEK